MPYRPGLRVCACRDCGFTYGISTKCINANDVRVFSGPVLGTWRSEDRADGPGIDTVPPDVEKTIFSSGIALAVQPAGRHVVASCVGGQRAGNGVEIRYAPTAKGAAPKNVLHLASLRMILALHHTC